VPVIVIGADTTLGESVIHELRHHDRDIRAFVSDPAVAADLRKHGIKVALGDVSDGSHVGAAAAGCFSAIVIPEAALDDRLRSFADSPEATISTWASALDEASISRLISFEDNRIPGVSKRFADLTVEIMVILTEGRSPAAIAVEAARADDLDSITEV